jgi:RNA polymerase sigma factor (sigma-70 family)
MDAVSQSVEAKLAEISPTLTRIANRYNDANPVQDADDLYQIMCLAIFERALADPEFLYQTNAYIIGWGAFALKKAARCKTADRALPFSQVGTCNKHGDTMADTIPDPDQLDPLEVVIETEDTWNDAYIGEIDIAASRLRRAIAGLAADESEIITAYCAGKTKAEIARDMEVSKSNITHRMHRIIRKKLRPAVIGV